MTSRCPSYDVSLMSTDPAMTYRYDGGGNESLNELASEAQHFFLYLLKIIQHQQDIDGVTLRRLWTWSDPLRYRRSCDSNTFATTCRPLHIVRSLSANHDATVRIECGDTKAFQLGRVLDKDVFSTRTQLTCTVSTS